MSNSNHGYVQKNLPDKLRNIGLLLVGVGLVLGVAGFLIDKERALFNYLLSYVFLISVAVGCLFLIALENVTGSVWSVPFRRVPEFFASILPVLLLLSIPLLLNMHSLYEWSHTETVKADKILSGKSSYLNTTSFIIRVLVCFGIWILFYFGVSRNSRKQDETKDQKLTKKNTIYSAIFIPLFAFSISVAAIDWMMSLAPHWFSTIYGVYFFGGAVVIALAVITLTVVLLKENGYLTPRINNEHLYSLGALMFGFVNFWAYIAFSQFLLIWYANLPEETSYFYARWHGNWWMLSLLLMFVHFLVPYAVLLSQPGKMDPKRLKFISIWLIFAHFVDLYWLIMPQFHAKTSSFLFIFELAFPAAAIGFLILVFYMNSKKHKLIPVGDPKLERGLDFKL